MKLLLALLPLLTVLLPPKPPKLTNRSGTLTVTAISRGVYQYVLTDGATKAQYVPTNLPDSVKQQAMDYTQTTQKPMPVIFSGTLGKGTSQLRTAGANDVPAETKTAVRTIRLTSIR